MLCDPNTLVNSAHCLDATIPPGMMLAAAIAAADSNGFSLQAGIKGEGGEFIQSEDGKNILPES